MEEVGNDFSDHAGSRRSWMQSCSSWSPWRKRDATASSGVTHVGTAAVLEATTVVAADAGIGAAARIGAAPDEPTAHVVQLHRIQPPCQSGQLLLEG